MIRAQASVSQESLKPIVSVFSRGHASQSQPFAISTECRVKPTQPPSPAFISSPWSHLPPGLQHPGLHMGLPTETSSSFQPIYLSLALPLSHMVPCKGYSHGLGLLGNILAGEQCPGHTGDTDLGVDV